MDDERKIRFLHKTMAVSGFLFALTILPVAQYVIISNRIPVGTDTTTATARELGSVAGVSTDADNEAVKEEHAVNGDEPVMVRYATVDQCLAKRDLDLSQLESWNTQMQKFYMNQFSTQPEVAELETKLNNTALSQAQRNDISAALDLMRSTYGVDKKLSDLKRAVDNQKTAILSRTCNN